MQEKCSLIYPRVKHFRADEKYEVVDTDEEENLVASSIERSVIITVELLSPLARFSLVLHIEAQNVMGCLGEHIRSGI